MRPLFAAAVAAVLLVPGCTGASDPSAPVPALRGAEACENRDDAISGGERRGDPLVGDVTGDERDDVVALVVDPEGTEGCRAFLWLRPAGAGEDEGEVLAIQQEGMEVGGVFSVPRIEALLEVDDRPGAEVVAVLLAGASTELAALFSSGGGSMERLQAEGGESLGGLFPHGGGAAQQQASDCSGDGEIVTSGAVIPSAETDRYLVTRTFFVRERDVYLADLARTQVHREVAPNRLSRFPEFTGSLFASCSPA